MRLQKALFKRCKVTQKQLVKIIGALEPTRQIKPTDECLLFGDDICPGYERRPLKLGFNEQPIHEQLWQLEQSDSEGSSLIVDVQLLSECNSKQVVSVDESDAQVKHVEDATVENETTMTFATTKFAKEMVSVATETSASSVIKTFKDQGCQYKPEDTREESGTQKRRRKVKFDDLQTMEPREMER